MFGHVEVPSHTRRICNHLLQQLRYVQLLLKADPAPLAPARVLRNPVPNPPPHPTLPPRYQCVTHDTLSLPQPLTSDQ